MNTKENIIKEYGKSDTDTGSTEVQIALLSERISHLTDHLKEHRKGPSHKKRSAYVSRKKKKTTSISSKSRCN